MLAFFAAVKAYLFAESAIDRFVRALPRKVERSATSCAVLSLHHVGLPPDSNCGQAVIWYVWTTSGPPLRWPSFRSTRSAVQPGTGSNRGLSVMLSHAVHEQPPQAFLQSMQMLAHRLYVCLTVVLPFVFPLSGCAALGRMRASLVTAYLTDDIEFFGDLYGDLANARVHTAHAAMLEAHPVSIITVLHMYALLLNTHPYPGTILPLHRCRRPAPLLSH